VWGVLCVCGGGASSYDAKLETEENMDLLARMERAGKNVSPHYSKRACVHVWAHFLRRAGRAPGTGSFLSTLIIVRRAIAPPSLISSFFLFRRYDIWRLLPPEEAKQRIGPYSGAECRSVALTK
jgi:hypothetical protein